VRAAFAILLVAATAQAAPRPSRKLALEALGPELLGDTPVRVRITDNGRIVGCVAASSITCVVFEPPEPYHLDVLSADEAKQIDRGESSASTQAALRHDMEIFRSKLGDKSRALRRECVSGKPIVCHALGSSVTVKTDAELDVPDAGDQADLAFDDVGSCGVHPVHGEVWSDAKTRTLFVLVEVQADCDKHRTTTIVHRVELR
jgi:hypothetical protein